MTDAENDALRGELAEAQSVCTKLKVAARAAAVTLEKISFSSAISVKDSDRLEYAAKQLRKAETVDK